MFKGLVKKSKSNKGFTLIELIVVIAIIAILALILVPRFAGFTDTAKENADKATAKTIETAVQTLIAGGKISGDGSFYINNGTDYQDVSGDVTGTAIESDFQELLGTGVQEQAGAKAGYIVTMTGSAISVKGR
jgi:prepilin-type N-terminal cleavage/methylation domain-containing protein